MSNCEKLYETLLNAGFTDSEIELEIKKKSRLYGGFLSTGAILLVIAKEKGLDTTKYEEEFETDRLSDMEIDYQDFQIDISSISEGTKNIVLMGRIASIHGMREFQRKDGTRGIVGSFTINDKTGSIKVVLWDGQVRVMNNEFFKFNEIVRIIRGYPKVGLNDLIEVHLNRKGLIQIAPDGTKASDYPLLSLDGSIESRPTKKSINIAELLRKSGFYEKVIGRVKIEEFVEKNLKNGEKSFLLRFLLYDDDNNIEVIVWGMKAVEYFKILVEYEEENIVLYNVLVKENQYTRSNQIKINKNTILKKFNNTQDII
ncbi:MAG: hypothetical protein ACFFAS_14910 [Promethearchaeota archaeon]